MPYYEFMWTDEIIEHIAEHDLAPDDFEQVVDSNCREHPMPTAHRPIDFKLTPEQQARLQQ